MLFFLSLGLGIWPASILLSRWAVALGNTFFNNKVVVELGAGCGLPGFATAVHCGARKVYVTDIHDPTLDNAVHNLKINADRMHEQSTGLAEGVIQVPDVAHETVVQVKKVNWKDQASFPEEKADIILLVPALKDMLAVDGEILYVAPDTGRDGMMELVGRLAEVNLFLIESAPVPER